MTKLTLACGLIITLAACASNPPPAAMAATAAPAAGTQAAAPAATQARAQAAKPKLICDDTSQIGSHMAQRICMTPEQAEARRKAAQQAAQEFQMQSKQSCPQSGCGTPPR